MDFKYFVGILILWIALPIKYMKLNVQWIKKIPQYFLHEDVPAQIDLQGERLPQQILHKLLHRLKHSTQEMLTFSPFFSLFTIL